VSPGRVEGSVAHVPIACRLTGEPAGLRTTDPSTRSLRSLAQGDIRGGGALRDGSRDVGGRWIERSRCRCPCPGRCRGRWIGRSRCRCRCRCHGRCRGHRARARGTRAQLPSELDTGRRQMSERRRARSARATGTGTTRAEVGCGGVRGEGRAVRCQGGPTTGAIPRRTCGTWQVAGPRRHGMTLIRSVRSRTPPDFTGAKK
jgi:hypothetical protein